MFDVIQKAVETFLKEYGATIESDYEMNGAAPRLLAARIFADLLKAEKQPKEPPAPRKRPPKPAPVPQ